MSEQCAEHMPDAYATSTALSICTDVTERTERTDEESLSPTRDNNSSVTRTPAYRFSSDGSEPDRWHCTICDARGRGGHTALHAHYMLHHWHEVKP